MVAAAVIAYVANNNARQATARQYRASALADLNTNPGQSISEALQSLQIETSVENYSALHQAMFANHLRSRLNSDQGKVYGIAVSPDRTRLATLSTERILKVWRLNGATIEQPPLLTVKDVGTDGGEPCTNFCNPLSFSPDGKYLALVNNYWEIVLLDSLSGEVEDRLDLNSYNEMANIVFIPNSSSLNGVLLLLSSGDAVLEVELGGGSGRVLAVGNTPDSSVGVFAFRLDGKVLTGGQNLLNNNGDVKLWNLPSQSTILGNTLSQSTFLGFNPSLWDQTVLARKAGEPVYSLALSPDGSQVAFTTGNDIHILDLAPLAAGAAPVERLTADSDRSRGFIRGNGAILSSWRRPAGKRRFEW